MATADSDTEVYNTSEFYALQVTRLCVQEMESEESRSGEIIDLINQVIDRLGMTGVGCLVAALGRFGTAELAFRAGETGADLEDLVVAREMHKMRQHAEEDRSD